MRAAEVGGGEVFAPGEQRFVFFQTQTVGAARTVLVQNFFEDLKASG